jgi:glucose-6-phosphate isomerase
MANLEEQSGLPISLNSQGKLNFNYSQLEVEPAARKAFDMKEVIYKYNPVMADRVLYYMYRNIAFEDDKEKIEDAGLRYDITVISSESLGPELIKTKGHYHPIAKGSDITYPEVYEVLFGEAYYLIQKPKSTDFSIIEEIYLINATAGQHIVIPPGFGHVTINPGPNPLVMSNWVNNSFESNYQPYQIHKGAGYFLLNSNKKVFELKRNSNYKEVPELSTLTAIDQPQFGLSANRPMYEIIKSDISRLDFLSNPQKYNLKISNLFKND